MKQNLEIGGSKTEIRDKFLKIIFIYCGKNTMWNLL